MSDWTEEQAGPEESPFEWAAREAPRAEQPSAETATFVFREMTPDEIRADELANLLGFIEGDHEGRPTRKQIDAAIRFRIGELTRGELREPYRVEDAPQAEQPSALARLSGAISSEARSLPFEPRMALLTGLVEAVSGLVAEAIDADVVGWERSEVPEAPEIREVHEIPEEGVRVFYHHDDGKAEDITGRIQSLLDERLDAVEKRLALPAALDFLNGFGEDIEEQIRGELATIVAARLTEQLSR